MGIGIYFVLMLTFLALIVIFSYPVALDLGSELDKNLPPDSARIKTHRISAITCILLKFILTYIQVFMLVSQLFKNSYLTKNPHGWFQQNDSIQGSTNIKPYVKTFKVS